MKSRRWIFLSAILAVVGVLLFSGAITPDLLAAEHGAEGGSPLNPLESIRGDLALWTAVTFLVVLALLWKFAWGPIMAGLDKRESYVHAQRTDAEKANADAKALLEEYKQQLAQAKSEIQQMKADAVAAAERSASQLMDKTKKDIEESQKVAQQEIANAKVQAQKELAGNAAELAVLLAGTILKRELDPKAHAALINDAVAKFGK